MTETSLATWSLHKVFVQLNLVDGFRYLDRSGVVLNRIRRDYQELAFVDPIGLLLRGGKREELPYEVRFSTDRIWLYYTPVTSLERVAVTAPPIIRDIARDIETQSFDRLGLRAEYFVPSERAREASDQIASKIIGGPFSSFLTPTPRDDLRLSLEIPFSREQKDIIVRVRKIDITTPATKPGDYPQAGLSFDIDVGQRSSQDSLYRPADIPKLAESAVKTLKELLSELGRQILEGVKL